VKFGNTGIVIRKRAALDQLIKLAQRGDYQIMFGQQMF
tara:strand:- start:2 stop:115 length:114 start_codon:yes stop_codon:yes gene_type:complete